MKKRYPYYLANKPQRPNFALEVLDKYTGETVARVAYADTEAISRTGPDPPHRPV